MASKNMPTAVSSGVYEFPYQRPDEGTRWQRFKSALYDPKRNTYFGRSGKDWGGLLVFYIIFFSAVAALFSISMYGLLSTLSPDHPKWQLESSIIGVNPGLGYRPYPEKFADQGAVIWYKANDPGNVEKWVKALNKFLDKYIKTDTPGYDNRVACDEERPAPDGKVCDVPVEDFGPCSPSNGYSYNRSSPCIFIKLNRIFGWEPEIYTKDNIPEDMDPDLKDIIRNSTERNIWLTCTGERPVDHEALGPIKYFPRQGFASFYYPFTNVKGYLSPLVAVQLVRPELHRLINIECRAWAANIQYEKSKEHSLGSVHFEILID